VSSTTIPRPGRLAWGKWPPQPLPLLTNSPTSVHVSLPKINKCKYHRGQLDASYWPNPFRNILTLKWAGAWNTLRSFWLWSTAATFQCSQNHHHPSSVQKLTGEFNSTASIQFDSIWFRHSWSKSRWAKKRGLFTIITNVVTMIMANQTSFLPRLLLRRRSLSTEPSKVSLILRHRPWGFLSLCPLAEPWILPTTMLMATRPFQVFLFLSPQILIDLGFLDCYWALWSFWPVVVER